MLKLLRYSMVGIVVAVVFLSPAFAQDDDKKPDPLGGATEFARVEERTAVTLMLDWVPNTNHTGIFVAQQLGFYDEANLDVEIIEPVDVLVEPALDTGLVQFGIGFQEFTSYAIVEGSQVVSIAAIMQNNTSGFATRTDNNPIERPSDLANLAYGGFSFPDLENAMLDLFLSCDGAEWNTDNYLDIGFADPLELLDLERIDFAWIFYGVQGIRAELEGNELDVLLLQDYADCVPDYYTPILLTSRRMIEDNPDVVAAFVQATARGYAVAITDPEAAANTLLEAVPELDEEFVRASIAWMSERYQGDAPRWGQQSTEVWQGFTDFMVEYNLLEEAFDVSQVFTNDFLPGTVEVTP